MRSLKLAAAVLLVFSAAPSPAQTTPADAMALERAGRLAEATQAWRSVVAAHPRDAGALASLGIVLARQQRYAEAVETYRRALALDPQLPGIQLNLGLALFKLGKSAPSHSPR
jgi:Flp pilus assembly protein TadD